LFSHYEQLIFEVLPTKWWVVYHKQAKKRLVNWLEDYPNRCEQLLHANIGKA